MSARRRAMAAPKGAVVAGVPSHLPDPEAEAWRDDDRDLAGHGKGSGLAREAAVWLGRRRRHRQAVEAWALEQGWTLERYPHRPDRARILTAGIPIPGYVLQDGRAVPTGDDQQALYRLLFD